MLQTLLGPGQTERVEAALAALDEHERGDPEICATLTSLRLAQHDPRAGTAALAGPDSVLMAFLIHPAPELLERHSRQRTGRAVHDGRGLEPARRDGGDQGCPADGPASRPRQSPGRLHGKLSRAGRQIGPAAAGHRERAGDPGRKAPRCRRSGWAA